MADTDRYVRREWETILRKLNVLTHYAKQGRFSVVCTDGLTLGLRFNPEDRERHRTVSRLAVNAPPDMDLRELFKGSRNPAKGKFFGVDLADIVDLIWQHGGVDLEESRKSNEE